MTKKALCFGFFSSISAAFIGSVVVSLTFTIHMLIVIGPQNDWLLSLLFLSIILWAVIFIPVGIGGYILELVLRHLNKNGTLTITKAKRTGSILATVTALILCLLFFLYSLLGPHDYYQIFLNEIKQEDFLKTFFLYFWNDLIFLLRYLPEILTVIITAWFGGAWVGRNIAKPLLLENRNSQNLSSVHQINEAKVIR